MTPEEFARKWTAVLRPAPPTGPTERALSQQHFLDLCELLGHKKPADADPSSSWFCFERPLTKISGTKGYADVWKRDFFAMEYKGPHKDLTAAYAQLKTYTDALENPPLLVVSDIDRIIIHTNFTATAKAELHIGLDDVTDPEKLAWLRALFHDPERLRPGKTRVEVTRDAADRFGEISIAVGERYSDKNRVAHFLNRLVFCLFSEDIGLLPDQCFTKMVDVCVGDPDQFPELCGQLFAAMANRNGRIGWTKIDWFNGGLFDNSDVLELTIQELKALRGAAALDWSNIEPAIFGTLFERGLDPAKRDQLGAHYTDPETIDRLIDPVIRRPLREEWQACREDIAALHERADVADAREKAKTGKRSGAATALRKEAEQLYLGFLEKLKSFRVLDPACGSGNFLYLSLKTLKDIERQVRTDAALLGLPVGVLFETGPENVLGIELNPYAAELARVSVWIGEIQWMIQNGYGVRKEPILRTLDQIQCRDALVADGELSAAWPTCNVIVGNPPFKGEKYQRRELGDEYTELIRRVYAGVVPARGDLVVYWLVRAAHDLISGKIQAFGLVATKSIAKGASRHALDLLDASETAETFEAWSNEPWVVDGASVRVALVCAARTTDHRVKALNGSAVQKIAPDLTAESASGSVTKAKSLATNEGVAFQGVKLNGAFDLRGEAARLMLADSGNPNGRPNSDVLRLLLDIDDVVGRPSDRWVVDFTDAPSKDDAMLYQAPFERVEAVVKPARLSAREERTRDQYWLFQRARPKLRSKIAPLQRYLLTPESSEHRVFVWADPRSIPVGSLFAFAKEDDEFFGILQSRIHEAWSSSMGNRLGVGNQRRYNATVTFETFPFPDGLSPDLVPANYTNSSGSAIAEAARRLNDLREAWLNPPEWTERMAEVAPGYPERVLARTGREANLKKRTLTGLYNESPVWLVSAHEALDRVVASAYGWEWPMSDQEITNQLLALNLARSS